MNVCIARGCINLTNAEFCSFECQRETERLEEQRHRFWGDFELAHRKPTPLRWEPSTGSRNVAS